MFTKNDLRNGDVILKRNGHTEIVVLPLGTVVVKPIGYNLLDDINDDLTSRVYSKYDIVAVRRPTKPSECRFDAFELGLGELVYDRKQKRIPMRTTKCGVKVVAKIKRI